MTGNQTHSLVCVPSLTLLSTSITQCFLIYKIMAMISNSNSVGLNEINIYTGQIYNRFQRSGASEDGDKTDADAAA